MAKTSEQVIKAKDYFNLPQFRGDIWATLREGALELKANPKRIKARKKIEFSFKILNVIEQYFAFPGLDHLNSLTSSYEAGNILSFSRKTSRTVKTLISEEFRNDPDVLNTRIREVPKEGKRKSRKELEGSKSYYFEVLFVNQTSGKEEKALKQELSRMKENGDRFYYKILHASSFQDALICLLVNPNIQACVIRYGIPFRSRNDLNIIKPFLTGVKKFDPGKGTDEYIGLTLGKMVSIFRPELDLFYVTDSSISDVSDTMLGCFRRIFYRKEDLQELHLSIVRAIKERFETPFFSALVEYSQKPTGVFHAMPISRGNSVFNSRWIRDFADFYGRNIFLAETSATTGGLDSLLQPTGTLKKAQDLAAKAYGSQHTFFVTNGTSTANKIVLQALVKPGDLVLIDRDCHKSHHYGLVLTGAFPVYLDSYPVQKYSMYGAVPLAHIKSKLNELKKAGRLEKVKMLLLTNCTFDGLVYNVERIMEEVLAIKPDMVFLWDEAWFAFSRFTYTYMQRTAMFVAKKLSKKYSSEDYRDYYARQKKGRAGKNIGIPDPDKVKVRVYATQSTHKTLSSLRQGSMIHIFDQDFRKGAEESLHEAYMTHTSTSPNYQILASLDIGRRQVQFEGYELVEKSVEMAMVLRSRIHAHPKLRKYFDVLTVKDFIPGKYRKSGIEEYFNPQTGWSRMEEAWTSDEFVLDPTKINLHIGRTGVDGDTFKNQYLMDKFGIQINKTSRNTVLFMTNIGTTRSSVAYLLGVLSKISDELDETFASLNKEEELIVKRRIKSLTEENPPLPDFSHFHSSFQAVPGVPGGNIREAFFLAYNESKCEYMPLEDCTRAIRKGREIVSASFVIPYPPGFPILVPGQVASRAILEFLKKLDVKEIHGYRPELGLRIFCESILERQKTGTAMIGSGMGGGNGRGIIRKKLEKDQKK
jgi:arginine/lysine/ornithine decarboxylase